VGGPFPWRIDEGDDGRREFSEGFGGIEAGLVNASVAVVVEAITDLVVRRAGAVFVNESVAVVVEAIEAALGARGILTHQLTRHAPRLPPA